jgi:hypothetical protein
MQTSHSFAEAKEIAERAAAAAKEALEHGEAMAHGTSLPPRFFMFCEDFVEIINPIWAGAEERELAAMELRVRTAMRRWDGSRLWGVLLVMDVHSWRVPEDAAEQLGISSAEDLERILDEDPARIKAISEYEEALSINLETYLGNWQVLLPYSRAAGAIIWREPAALDSMELDGRFTDLLPPLPPAGDA